MALPGLVRPAPKRASFFCAGRARRRGRAALLAGLLAGLALAVLAPRPVLAQSPAPIDAVREHDLGAGPLATGLARLAAAAGVLFSVDARLVAGRDHAALRGRYSLREAFDRLLAGTGLELDASGAVLTLRPRAAFPRPEAVLPPVHARAPATAEAGEGYRATHAQQPIHAGTRLEELPQAVTVLPRELIRDQAPQSLAELLRHVPGLGAAQGEGNRDTPVFRGNLSTADFLIDGLRDDVAYHRDLYNIEQVEALRGPDAMAVGHGAVGGLINRVSKVPRGRGQRELALELGAWQHRRATLDWDQPLHERVAGRLNLMAEDSGGYREAFRLRRLGVNPVLAWRLRPGATLTLGYEHFEDRRTADRGIPSYQGRPVPTDPARFFGNPDASISRIRLDAFSAQLVLDLGDGLTLQHRSRFADHDKFFQNAFPGAVRRQGDTLEVALLAHNSRTRRRNVFHQTSVARTVEHAGMAHRLLAGIELGHQQGDNRRETGFFATEPAQTVLYVPLAQPLVRVPISFSRGANDPDNASQARVVALVLQDQLSLSPAWQATLGLRRDVVRLDVQDHQAGRTLASRDRLWSPRAGLRYQPVPALSLYANYSIGHALRAGEQLNLLTPANAGLAPERFVNRELGAKWSPTPGLDASLALYQLDRRDVAVPDPQAPTQALLLVHGQRTRGLELGLAGRAGARWQVMGGYTLQDSKVLASLSPQAPAGATLPHVPRHSLALWNRWTLDRRWAAGLGLQYRSALFTSTDNTVRLPGYTRVDAAMFYAPQPGWHLQLNVENLLDRRYYAFAHSNNNITPGAPRTLRLGLRVAF